ncbi:MAG: hypothetical protein JRH17_19115 [Deltaproteobacteria bacterium]|nr:hypothetical protein [Deltaproteobacteria bacterium]
MPPNELHTRLAKLPLERLAKFVANLADDIPELRERVEALALSGDPKSLAKLLRGRLMRVKRGRRFIHYRESRAFAAELSGWLADVEEGLLEADSEAALGLLEEFIRLDGRVLGRADDSDGLIGDGFRLACGMWQLAASKLPASPDWVKRTRDLHADNDYGVRDALLDEAALRLSELELRRLAKMYQEKAAPQPARKGRGTGKPGDVEVSVHTDDFERDWEASTAATAMGQVAVVLQDAALYEKSLRIRSPQLNTLQAADVAKKYVEFGPVEMAVPLLEFALGDNRNLGQLDVLAEAYEKLGDSAKLRETRRRLFEQSVSSAAFAEYLACLPKAERAKAKKSAIAKVVATGDPFRVAQFLLDIGDPKSAARIVEKASGGLMDVFYAHLLALAKDLERGGQLLPATLCYRALSEQILQEARSKAYGHASRYVAKLDALHRQLDGYGDFPDHAAYMAGLRERHGRKHAFWKRVEGAG